MNEQGLRNLVEWQYEMDKQVDLLASDKKESKPPSEKIEVDWFDNEKMVEIGRALRLYRDMEKFEELFNDVVSNSNEESEYKVDLSHNVYEKLFEDGLGYDDWEKLNKPEKHAEVIAKGVKMAGEMDSVSEASENIADETGYKKTTIGLILREEAPIVYTGLMSEENVKRLEGWIEKKEKEKEFRDWEDRYMDPNEETLAEGCTEAMLKDEGQSIGSSYDVRVTEERNNSTEDPIREEKIPSPIDPCEEKSNLTEKIKKAKARLEDYKKVERNEAPLI